MAKTKRVPRKRRPKHPVFQWRAKMKPPVKRGKPVLYDVMVPAAHYDEFEVLARSRAEAVATARDEGDFKAQWANPGWSRRTRVRKI